MVFWSGRQWAVTSNGIESHASHEPVVFRKEALSQVDDGFRHFAVVAKALKLPWLDVDDFRTAWAEAQIWHATAFENVPLVWRAALEAGTSDILDRMARAVVRRVRNHAA